MTIGAGVAFAPMCRIVVVLVALCASDVQVVLAQAKKGAAKPGKSGLFGGSQPPPPGPGQSVDMTVSISGAYDDDLVGDQAVGGNQPFGPRVGGQSSDVDVSLSLAERRQRVSLSARAASSFRRYPNLNDFIGSNHSAGADLIANLGRRTTFRTRVDASYASYFAYDAFSRQSALPQVSPSLSESLENAPPEISPVDLTMTSYGGTADLTRTLGRHASLGLTYGVRYGERVITGERDDERTVGAHVGRSVGKSTSVQVVYTFRDGQQRFGGLWRPVASHDAQLGVERQWRHSAVGRTVVNLAAGPSSLEQDGTRQIRLVGSAALTQEIGGWRARLSFRRGAGLTNGLVRSDAATVDLRRSVGPRVEITGSGGYADPEVGFDFAGRYRTTFGSARFQVALTKFLAAYGQYVLYRYDLGNDAPAPTGYQRQLDRRGLRAGVTLWMPVHRG